MNDAQKTIAGALLIGGSLLSTNPALITAAGGIGVNWASDGLLGLRRTWRARTLDTPMARAASAAIHASVEGLRGEYVRTRDGRSPTAAFDLVAACADDIGNTLFPAAEMNADDAQAQLARGLDALLHGHDERQVAFLQQRLLPTTALALRDALAADPEAWMRFHGWLIEDLRASQTQLSAKFDNVAEVLARLQDPTAALQAVTGSLSRIDDRTARMAQQQDDIADNVRRLLAMWNKTGAGPTFNNQGMQVSGSVYQTSGTINITNASGGAASGAGRASPSAGPDKAALRVWLVQHFSRADLALLCADVQARLAATGFADMVNLEVIGGNDAMPLQCQNLIGYLDQRGKLAVLVEVANALRPGAPFG